MSDMYRYGLGVVVCLLSLGLSGGAMAQPRLRVKPGVKRPSRARVSNKAVSKEARKQRRANAKERRLLKQIKSEERKSKKKSNLKNRVGYKSTKSVATLTGLKIASFNKPYEFTPRKLHHSGRGSIEASGRMRVNSHGWRIYYTNPVSYVALKLKTVPGKTYVVDCVVSAHLMGREVGSFKLMTSDGSNVTSTNGPHGMEKNVTLTHRATKRLTELWLMSEAGSRRYSTMYWRFKGCKVTPQK